MNELTQLYPIIKIMTRYDFLNDKRMIQSDVAIHSNENNIRTLCIAHMFENVFVPGVRRNYGVFLSCMCYMDSYVGILVIYFVFHVRTNSSFLL